MPNQITSYNYDASENQLKTKIKIDQAVPNVASPINTYHSTYTVNLILDIILGGPGTM